MCGSVIISSTLMLILLLTGNFPRFAENFWAIFLLLIGFDQHAALLERLTNGAKWDDELQDNVKKILEKLKEWLCVSDTVSCTWSVSKDESVRIQCDASSWAIGAVLEVGGTVVDNGCWLRKKRDPLHINVAEPQSVIKGLTLAIEWRFKKMDICTDSASVKA